MPFLSLGFWNNDTSVSLSVVRQLMDGFATHHHRPSFPHVQGSLMLGRTSQPTSEFQHILVVCLAKWCWPFLFLLPCLIEWEDFQDSWSKRNDVETEFYPIDCTTFSSAFSYCASFSHWMVAGTSYIKEVRASTGDVFEIKVRWIFSQVVCIWEGQMCPIHTDIWSACRSPWPIIKPPSGNVEQMSGIHSAGSLQWSIVND